MQHQITEEAKSKINIRLTFIYVFIIMAINNLIILIRKNIIKTL